MPPTHAALTRHEDFAARSPILIAAFRGWNDAGDAASFAAEHLSRVWGAKRFASIDPEDFIDFQSVRPTVELLRGSTRRINWPSNELHGAKIEGSPHDIIVLVGTEPSYRWKAFSKLIVDVAKEHGVQLVITLGALLADVPHSRPVPITGTAGDEELIARLGLQRSRYEGPTGIVGVLHDAFAREGIGSVSLWAAVPHYLAVTPNPKAALALVDKTVELVKVSAEVDELHRAALVYDDRVNEIVGQDEDVESYVRLLEARADEGAHEEQTPLPDLTGDAIADELERFLRDRDK